VRFRHDAGNRPAKHFIQPRIISDMTVSNVADPRKRFAYDLTQRGLLRDPQLHAAFDQVPREAFLRHFFRPALDGTSYDTVDFQHPAWLDMVYSDGAWPIQLDGRICAWELPHGCRSLKGLPTSTSTSPSLAAMMLEQLDLRCGHQVLEIGTGSGYTTALLCHRLGSPLVTSIDIDPVLVDRARAQLQSCGYYPALGISDHVSGDAGNDPYDRLIATCGVPAIPPDWLTQVRPAGVILAQIYRELGVNALVRLTVDDDHSARGFFLPYQGGFAPTRSYRPLDPGQRFRRAIHEHGTVRPTEPGLALALPNRAASLVMFAGLLMPGVARLDLRPPSREPQTWLFHPDGSWARHDTRSHTVEQHGPRLLWDQVERFYREWCALGRPSRERFGLTVTTELQWLWLDSPHSGHQWVLP
jgi:protein-L-isoaspartate(D-aspartate) O-methyltransferase